MLNECPTQIDFDVYQPRNPKIGGYLVTAGTLPKARYRIFVKSSQAFPNLYGRSRLALPGTTIRRHNRGGYFWGDRIKSVIVDKGETLVNCLAYIDLNPLRGGLVDRPEDYRWNKSTCQVSPDGMVTL